jgi:hypothetical protein
MPIIPATWEAKMRKIAVQGQSRQKVCETPPQLINWACCYTLVILGKWEAITRKIPV